MNRTKKMVKNAIIILVGSICTKMVTFLMLPALTAHLSTEEYGTLDIILASTSLIAPIFTLQIERSVFRFLVDARKDDEMQQKIVATSMSVIALSFMVVSVLFPIFSIILNIEKWPLILLVLYTSMLLNVFLQIPRGLGKNIHFSIGSAIVGIVNATISIIGVAILDLGIDGVLAATIIANILGTLYIMISLRLTSKIRISRRDRIVLKELLKFSIPMIPNDICYWIISISDRFLLYLFVGSASNGIYAAATKFPTIVVTAYNIFNLSWIEAVSEYSKDPDAEQYLAGAFGNIVKLSGGACLVLVAFMPLLFNVLIDQKFDEAYYYIPVLILGAFFSIIVGALSAIYFGYKKTKDIAKTNAVAAVINIVVNIVLINVIGIWAAVISTVLSYLIVAIYRMIDIRNTIKIKIGYKVVFALTPAFATCIALSYLDNVWIILSNIAISIIVAIILNKDSLGKVINKMKGKNNEKALAKNSIQKQ